MCAFPEELPFARLAWTGSRMLNRMMRLQAIALGINLGAHAIRTPIVLARLRPHFEVLPFKYVRSEEDVLRISAGGTDAFAALVGPVLRNA